MEIAQFKAVDKALAMDIKPGFRFLHPSGIINTNGIFSPDRKTNMSAKRFVFAALLFFLALTPPEVFSLSSRQPQPPGDLASEIQSTLNSGDIPGYAALFSPRLREREKRHVFTILREKRMDKVAVFWAGKEVPTENGYRVYLSVVFENAYAVMIEVWRLDVEVEEGVRLITEKTVTRDVQNLYKLRIPSGEEQRVKRVEIRQTDISLSFQNPVVFYDNIPGDETALLILGEGRVLFSPSSPRERRLLQLVMKKDVYADKVDHAYIRCSPSTFKKNIRIEEEEGETRHVTQTDLNRAYSLFAKYYPRSFTVKNSLIGEYLTLIPQEEETVIEFKGQKRGTFTYIYSPFAEEEITLYQWEKNRILSLYSPQSKLGEKRLFLSFEEKFDATRLEVDIDFEPRDLYLSGRARVAVVPQTGFLDKVKLKLNPRLEILRIVDAKGNDLFFTRDDLRSAVYIYFLEPVTRTDPVSFQVFYRGKLPPSKVEHDVLPGGQYEDTVRFVPIRYRTYLYSLSSLWYPVPPEGDYFTAKIRIIIPQEYSVVASGRLVEESRLQSMERVEELEKVGRKVSVFESTRPLKYLSFIVGDFEEKDEVLASLPLRVFRTPEIRAQGRDFVQETMSILAFYQSRFGPFPFDSLSIVQRLWPESGGHSPASFVVLNQPPRLSGGRLLRTESPVNLTQKEGYFLAHEIAHQWWGQAVTWETYHDLWISEGLAQFASLLYLREKYGEKVYSDLLQKMSKWTQDKARWGPILLGSRLSYFDFLAFQAIVYNRASLALNMLMDMLGEELFFQGVREFYSRFRYGEARTFDFMKTLADVSRRDLAPFFDAWFRSSSLPDVRIITSVEEEGNGPLIRLNIQQVGEKFVFPLWVEWTADGKRFKSRVVVEERRQSFTLPTRGKPGKIRVNSTGAVPGRFRRE